MQNPGSAPGKSFEPVIAVEIYFCYEADLSGPFIFAECLVNISL